MFRKCIVVASPDNSSKPIHALASVNEEMARTVFHWRAWPNFTDRGAPPQWKKYALRELVGGNKVGARFVMPEQGQRRQFR